MILRKLEIKAKENYWSVGDNIKRKNEYKMKIKLFSGHCRHRSL